MSYYWAKFEEISNQLFRFDTRVYLNYVENPMENDLCIGAVVGKNPGSARPSCINNTIQKIKLDSDQLLPNIRSIFLKAYEYCGKQVPQKSYIQILNSFYLCNKEFSQGIKIIKEFKQPILCDKEEKHFPFLWYVWGGYDKELTPYQIRFQNIRANLHFYLDNKTQKVTTQYPTCEHWARHTQGMKHESIVPFISSII